VRIAQQADVVIMAVGESADMSGEADDARLGKTDLKGTIAEVGKWPPILDIRLQC